MRILPSTMLCALACSLLFPCLTRRAEAFEQAIKPVSSGSDVPDVVQKCQFWIASRKGSAEPQVRREGADGLCLDMAEASIEEDIGTAFVNALQSIPTVLHPKIVVRSSGGDIPTGVSMAEAMLPRKATVYVSMFCISSCANYLFGAADHRVILPDSFVMYHGGLTPMSLQRVLIEPAEKAHASPATIRKMRDRFDRIIERQNRLLAERGINPDFYRWMESLNDADMADVVQEKCHAEPGGSVNYLVLSDAALAKNGIAVEKDEGPRTPEALKATLKRFGLADKTCFWQ